MCVDVASTIVLCRSFAKEYEQKCGVSKFREFINSAPAVSKTRNWSHPQFTAGSNLHRYILHSLKQQTLSVDIPSTDKKHHTLYTSPRFINRYQSKLFIGNSNSLAQINFPENLEFSKFKSSQKKKKQNRVK
jgi:hypothetical protein